MARWPGSPDGFDSESYWLGVATTLAFAQAQLDVKLTAVLGQDPVLRVRLPYMERPEPEDLHRFGRAIDQLNEDCKVLYWRLVKTDHDEHYVEVASTEGYQGLPEGWR